jgi:hypothetical protein
VRALITNKETARMALVVPFIRLLGYDPNIPKEVRLEYAAEFTQGITWVPAEEAKQLVSGFTIEEAPVAFGISRVYIESIAQAWAELSKASKDEVPNETAAPPKEVPPASA